MRLIGRILAIVLVLIIPLLLMAASCNFAIYSTMSNEQTYRNAFADRSLLTDVLPRTVPVLFDGRDTLTDAYSGNMTIDTVIQAIDVREWESIMGDVVSSVWMQNRFDQLLRLFTGILNDNYDTLDESVDVASIEARLKSDEAETFAGNILDAAPTCTEDELTALSDFERTKTGDFIVCDPEGDQTLSNFSLKHITGWLGFLSDQMDDMTVSQLYTLNRSEARGLHIILKMDEQMSYVTYLCPAALLALIVFFTVRSFRGFGRWIGATLLLSGIGVLLTLVGLQVLFVNIFGAAAQSTTEGDRLFTQIVVSLMRAGMGGISQSMLIQAGLMILLGFGLFGLTSFMGRGDLVSTGTMVLVTEDGRVISSTSLPQVPPDTGSTSRSGSSTRPKPNDPSQAS